LLAADRGNDRAGDARIAKFGVTGQRSNSRSVTNFSERSGRPRFKIAVIAGVAVLSRTNYHQHMKTITLKLPEQTLQRLKDEAKATGRSVAALIRERIETSPDGQSVHALAADLAGSVAGSRRAATNERRRFGRS
jgi:predicted DNA-binding protein